MESPNEELRKRIFRQELQTLKTKGYLDDQIVEEVTFAYQQYQLDLLEEEQKKNIINKVKMEEPEKLNLPAKPVKVKKVRTPEEIRERNITWLLNLGVIMLLIGGLFVATSNWESMTAIMKSGSIAAVSLLFFGFAYLSNKVLKIEKTSFAFIVLGSLFLPIFILSLGWFGLLGNYLSITGEGRYFIGVLGSFIPILIYLHFAKLLNSRLFVWFSYISLTVGIAFLLAGFQLPIDYFYLGMVIYNAFLVYSCYRFKKQERFMLFTNEMVVFAQINLVLSTLTMIFLYDQHAMNGFNLLLTSIIYLSMIFVTGKKEYHFIFSAMIVYGAYQVIEYSFLEIVGPILFALIAVCFLIIPRILNIPESLGKIFQITSAIISILSFLYISLEGLLLRMGEPSFTLLIAYFIIGSHFLIMSHYSKSTLFQYLSPVFYGSTLYELLSLIDKYLFKINFILEIFAVGFLLFLLFGIFRIVLYVGIIRKSSRDVGLVIMIFSMVLGQSIQQWWELGVMLTCFSFISYFLIKLDERPSFRELSFWILPVTLGLSVVAFGEEISLVSLVYSENLGLPFGTIIAALLLLLTGYVWGNLGESVLGKNSFYISHLFYSFGMVLSFIAPVDPLWVRPVILIGGVIMYFLLFKKTRIKSVPYLMAVISLIFYLTLIDSIDRQIGIPEDFVSQVFPTGAVLLLVIAILFKKFSHSLFNAYAWIGHLFYPFTLIFAFFVQGRESLWSFLIAIFVYVLSLRFTNDGWRSYGYLYAAFTALATFISTSLNHDFYQYEGFHTFILTSVIILLFWFVANSKYKKQTMYYWVPFSIIGILYCISIGAVDITQYSITMLYIIVVLLVIHFIRWPIVAIIPLLLSFMATVEFISHSNLSVTKGFFLIAGIGCLLSLLGKTLFKVFLNRREKKIPVVDVYTPTSFLYFLFLYSFDLETIWLNAIPGILISILLFIQRNRIPLEWSFLASMLSGVVLIEPYYSVTLRLQLPSLWEREILVLPWVILVIFIQLIMNSRYKKLTNSLQWFVLITVAILLIQDGLASSTIYDAIILGSLSLVSLLFGIFLRIKAYFLVGSGVLLLNVFLQTKPFWGNMPWWTYLLIAGSILIYVASYNEWQKQKLAKGEKTLFLIIKQKLIQKWKEWN